jgi:hypothetical protein
MKQYLSVLLILISFNGWGKKDSVAGNNYQRYATYERHTAIATVSLGFIDDYRRNYSMPAGFEKSNTTGFTPLYIKLEYGLYRHTSIAVDFNYDAFVYNYKQDYVGNNGPFTRYRTDNARMFGGGITLFYHLQQYIHLKRFDPFVGIGASLNNIRYGAYPQGDSTVVKFDHIVTPYLKVGARYYVSNNFSLFGDLGFDKQSIFSLGFSCRFNHKSQRKK